MPLKENGKLDVGGSLGTGTLTVIKDLGLKEPYIGKIALVSGEIAEDLTAYYYISEQQNSAISLGVKVERDLSVGCAGGMIIQVLPDASEEAIDQLEKLVGALPPLTTLIDRVSAAAPKADEEERLSLLAAEIFSSLPPDFGLRPLETQNIDWYCDCSQERLEQALMTIGAEDLTEIIEEDGQAELVCQFCLKKYHFDKAHLERILASIK